MEIKTEIRKERKRTQMNQRSPMNLLKKTMISFQHHCLLILHLLLNVAMTK